MKLKTLLLSLAILFGVICEANAASRFLICNVTCTITPSDTSIWSATSGGGTGASVPGSSDTVTMNASSCVGGVPCTVTLNWGGTWTVQSITAGAFTNGTFDNSVNNNDITVTANGTSLNFNGSSVRTYNLGTATYTISGTSGGFSIAANNLTLNASSATLNITGTGDRNVLIGSGVNWAGSINISAGTSITYNAGGSPDNSVGALYIAPQTVIIPFGTRLISVAPLNWIGTPSNPYNFRSTANNLQGQILVASGSVINWASLKDMVGNISAPTNLTCNNCYNFGPSTFIIMNAPGQAEPIGVFGGH